MPLLAKSHPQLGLRQHTQDVVRAVAQLRAIWPDIPPTLETAAIFHDLGKAAAGFQAALRDDGPTWRFRHEVLSAAILRQCHDLKNDTLFNAYLAVLTHHKNLGTTFAVSEELGRCYSLTSRAKWFEKWRELLVNIAELKSEMAALDPALDGWDPDDATASPANEALQLIGQLRPIFECPEPAIARGALVAADHLASSGLRSTVLGHALSRKALERYAQDYIEHWTEWSDFQRRADAHFGSAVLVAPTGAGKTEAALLWALANRRSFERIFYVLPYQVSINAMASRIAKAFPGDSGRTNLRSNENVSILHANIDLAYLADAQSDDLPGEEARRVASHRADAARKIHAPIKVTTVFQLLHIFFGRKFFEVGLLELTNSLVIFDEIHAYDGHTMGLIIVLLGCLRKLGARIFIMTATLPSSLQADLCAAAGIASESEIHLPKDDGLLHEIRRILVRDKRKIEEMNDCIRAAVASGKKVAVVCNTVSKAIEMCNALSVLKPLLVHSRFTLGDRAKRERKENIERNRLVIATQVLEVSLDVSFDVMFTELAPADSLLQRFGRVNRHGSPADPSNIGVCHIACGKDAGSEQVYGAQILEKTKAHMPTDPLTFAVARRWIENVYPQGLAEAQREKMIRSRDLFQQVVAELRPMLDPLAEPNEESLFDSIQVIPVEMETEWRKKKSERNHIEAKMLVVNVSLSSWTRATAQAGMRIKRGEHGETVAPFKYDADRGLLLDQPLKL